MRNRAKCKLCKDIIESLSLGNKVQCSCGEIEIDGGQTRYLVSAKDLSNLLRIDDDDKEVIPIIQEATPRISKAEMLGMLTDLVKRYDGLSPAAMAISVNNYEFSSAMLLILAILRED